MKQGKKRSRPSTPSVIISRLIRNQSLQAVYFRLFKPRRYWNNRKFHPDFDLRDTPEGRVIVWQRQELGLAKRLEDLRPSGPLVRIIGSGPSMRSIAQPERLFLKPTLCVNGSYFLAEQHSRRPTYYFVSGLDFVEQKWELFRRAALAAHHVFLLPRPLQAIAQREPALLGRLNIYFCEDYRYPFRRESRAVCPSEAPDFMLCHARHPVCLSRDAARGLVATRTVIHGAIQLLGRIGYREIELYGTDLSGTGRFYPETKGPRTFLDQDFTDNILPGFELVRDWSKLGGPRVLNVCPESRLPEDVLPKADPMQILASASTPGP